MFDAHTISTLESYQHGLATFPDVRESERNLARAPTLDQAARAEVLTRSAAFAFSTGDLAPPRATHTEERPAHDRNCL